MPLSKSYEILGIVELLIVMYIQLCCLLLVLLHRQCCYRNCLCGWTNLAFSFVIMGEKMNILCVMVRKSDLDQSYTSDRVKGRISDTGNTCHQIIQS